MARKHCCPKRGRRARSRYPDRLARRGLRSAPAMAPASDLAKIQQARYYRTGSYVPGAREIADEEGGA